MNKLGLLSICLVEEKQYAVFGATRLRRMSTELFPPQESLCGRRGCPKTKNRVKWPLGACWKKQLSVSSLVFPCILHTNFFCGTPTHQLYGNLKETIYMIDKGDFDDGVCLLQSVCIASDNREENGTFAPQILLFQGAMLACYRRSSAFSSMWITSCLCQELSRPLKDFQMCCTWNSSWQVQTHTGCPCGLCEERYFTLSIKETRSTP